MPRGDRTGPRGYGPRTGWGLGFCSGHSAPGFAYPYNPGGGRWGGLGRVWGRGYWRGRGLGFRRALALRSPYGYQVAPVRVLSAEDEAAYLEHLRKSLEKELDEIKGRLRELVETQNGK